MDGTAPERPPSQALVPDPRRDDRTDRRGAGDSVALAIELESCQVTSLTDLRVRDAAWGEVLGVIYQGTQMLATARTESWINVTHLGHEGRSAAWLADSDGDCDWIE